MKTGSFICLNSQGFHKTAYTHWPSESAAAPLVCVHGLTRNGRDFDPLAQHLSHTRSLICPDVAGRGHSDWLSNQDDYNILQYGRDMVAMLAHFNVDHVDWLGTSMGGLIGMTLAALPNSPIKRLILNDIGPFIPKESLQTIACYLQDSPLFCSDIDANLYLRKIHSGFGPLTDSQWEHLTVHSINQAERDENGCFRLHYDPKIQAPFIAASQLDIDLWALWDQIDCPVLILRGIDSPLLTKETYERMLKKPKVSGHEVANTAHAPALMDSPTIQVIERWLEQTSP